MNIKPYRVAVIGTGMIANAAHLAVLTHLKGRGVVDVVGVADVRPEAVRETAARYHIPAEYTDPQRMLEELRPDVTAVCTPNAYHKQWSIAALRAGSHVICEKPMTVIYHDAIEMFGVAEKCGKLLFPAQRQRSD